MKIICALLVTLFVVSGCGSGSEQDSGMVMPNVGKEDVFITWLNYDGMGDIERAAYMVNRRVVGTGKEGFVAVIDLVKVLPPQSTILVYPKYLSCVITTVSEDGSTHMEKDNNSSRPAFPVVPFFYYPDECKELLQIIDEREINAFIAIDEKGTHRQPLSTCMDASIAPMMYLSGQTEK